MSDSRDAARYRQIAAALRARIEAGEPPPGAALPGEKALAAEYQVARETVRQALQVLRAEGLVVTSKGAPTRVRATVPIKRLGTDRYRRMVGAEAPGVTPFTVDQGGTVQDIPPPAVQYLREQAGPEVADRLQLPLGAPVLHRRFVFFAQGDRGAGLVPQQMSSSYVPWGLVAGTVIADVANEPYPGGTIGQMASLGLTVTHLDEEARCRMPTAQEARTLIVPDLVPVVCIKRVMWAGDLPVEAALDIVIPADRVVLVNRIILSGGGAE